MVSWGMAQMCDLARIIGLLVLLTTALPAHAASSNPDAIGVIIANRDYGKGIPARGGVTILARDRLLAVWAEAVEFRDAQIA